MGILSKVLGGAQIVIGAALIATGVGVPAGAFLIASGLGTLATTGMFGSGVANFMNSGWGKGLMAAVAIGGAGMAMYGTTALDANMAEAAASQASDSATALDNANIASFGGAEGAAASEDSALATSNSFLQATNTAGDAAGLQSADLAQISGVNNGSLAQLNAEAPENGGLGASAMQASASQTSADTQAGGSVSLNPKVSPGAPQDANVSGGGGAPGAQPSGLTGVSTSQDTGNLTKIPGQAAGAGGQDASNPANFAQFNAPTSGANSGILDKAAGLLNTRGGSAAVTAGGSLLGGLGQGIMQKQAMEQQEAALQWGNTQWANQSQADKAIAAAAQPVTVPQGYLQRAQQVRNMMAGGVPTPSGPVPTTAMAAPPVPGAAAAAATPQAPRGGVI